MDEEISQLKASISDGRTDVLNRVLESCTSYGERGAHLKRAILEGTAGGYTGPEGSLLHYAVSVGKKDACRSLLMAKADVIGVNSGGENPFELALAGSSDIQQVFVEELLQATANSDIERMEELISCGVDPNSWDDPDKKNTILHWAASFGNTAAVSYLIEKGSFVNSTNAENCTPLHEAVARGDGGIVQILLSSGASPLIKAEKGKYMDKSPLDLASTKPEIFSILSAFLASQFASSEGRRSIGRSGSVDSLNGVVGESAGSRKSSFNCNHNHSVSNSAFHSPHSTIDEGPTTPGEYSSFHLYNGFNKDLESAIRGVELKGPIQPIVTDTNLNLLWPIPRSLQQLEGLQFKPTATVYLSIMQGSEPVHRILDVFSGHKECFEALGYDIKAQQVESVYSDSSAVRSVAHSSQIQCSINPSVLSPSAYRLHISSEKVRITGGDLPGLHNAICTLLQLFRLYSSSKSIPPLIINDSPSLKHRGILLDLSLERIPNITNLFELIRQFSLLKINFLHLHLRCGISSFSLPLSKGEIVALDRHCADSHISLVPALEIPPGVSREEYFFYIRPVLQEILPCFASSNYIHLGPQLTTLLFQPNSGSSGYGFPAIWELLPVSRENTTIFLCYNALKALHSTSAPIFQNVPSNVILLNYGFQADYNFGSGLTELNQAGCSTIVTIGTSSWSSLSGCPEAALANIYNGTLSASANGSLGLIVANWSGSCNFTPAVFGWPGFLLGAGLGWNAGTPWEYLQTSLPSLLSTYILQDESGISGELILRLGCSEGDLHRSALNRPPNDIHDLPPPDGTTLYRLLTNPDTVPLEHLSVESFIRCIRSLKKCQNGLFGGCKLPRSANGIHGELSLTIELMLLACRIGRSLLAAGMNPRSNMGLSVVNLGIANLPPTIRTDIANKMLNLIEEYRRIWLSQNFPDGLDNSLFMLTTVLQRFIPDSSRIISGRLMSSSSIDEHSQSNGY